MMNLNTFKIQNMKAIIFDMDGTLINSEPLHAHAASIVLRDLGVNLNLEECLKDFYGMTDYDVLKIACPQLSESEILKTIDIKNQKLIHLLQSMPKDNLLQLMTPGLIPFLDKIKSFNIPMAVVSASEDIIVEETISALGINHYFQFLQGRSQTHLTKPHPDPYLFAMKKISSSANETIIFEDSPTGLKAAQTSHAHVIRITEFSHTESRADFTEIKNYNELMPFLI